MKQNNFEIRFRAHFEKDLSECLPQIEQAILLLTNKPQRKGLVKKLNTNKRASGFSIKNLKTALASHLTAPTWMGYETVISDGKPSNRQEFSLQLITWKNKNKPNEIRNESQPSSLECKWSPINKSDLFTDQDLHKVVKILSKAGLVYAFAGLCLVYPSSSFLNKKTKIRGNGTLYSDIKDGDNIDYHKVVRGAFWFNALGPAHIRILGGLDNIKKRKNAFTLRIINNSYLTLSLGKLPLTESSQASLLKHVILAKFLKPIFPSENIKATWRYKVKEKMADGRTLTNARILRRLLDKKYIANAGFEFGL